MAQFYAVSKLTGGFLGKKVAGETTIVNEKRQARGFGSMIAADKAARKANREMFPNDVENQFGFEARAADQVYGRSESI